MVYRQVVYTSILPIGGLCASYHLVGGTKKQPLIGPVCSPSQFAGLVKFPRCHDVLCGFSTWSRTHQLSMCSTKSTKCVLDGKMSTCHWETMVFGGFKGDGWKYTEAWTLMIQFEKDSQDPNFMDISGANLFLFFLCWLTALIRGASLLFPLGVESCSFF